MREKKISTFNCFPATTGRTPSKRASCIRDHLVSQPQGVLMSSQSDHFSLRVFKISLALGRTDGS